MGSLGGMADAWPPRVQTLFTVVAAKAYVGFFILHEYGLVPCWHMAAVDGHASLLLLPENEVLVIGLLELLMELLESELASLSHTLLLGNVLLVVDSELVQFLLQPLHLPVQAVDRLLQSGLVRGQPLLLGQQLILILESFICFTLKLLLRSLGGADLFP